MSTISRLIANLETVKLPSVLEDSIEETKKDIIRLQKDQLLRGERSDGKKIGRYKSKAYAMKKFALNPLAGFGFMDWKLSGDLHKEVFADVRESSVVLDSADPKTGALIKRLGDPFGLNRENSSEYATEYLAPEAAKRIKSQILK